MPENRTVAEIVLRIIFTLVAEHRATERKRREWMFDAPEPVWRAWLDDNL